MSRKSTLLSLSLGLLIMLSACVQTPPAPPAPAASSQPDTSEGSSSNPPVTVSAEADFETAENEDGTVTIKRYLGSGGDVVIPAKLDGKQVTAIGNTFEMTGAFQDCAGVTSVVIPEGVTEIQDNAFYGCAALETVTVSASVTLLRNCAFCDCPNLRAVYFEGDAPQQANYVFDSTENVTMYYRNGTSGWSNPWYGRPAKIVIDPANEPPLQEADWAIAVPDFLTEEQQLLYRRANNLYSHAKLGSDIEYVGNNIDLFQYETVQIGEDSYYVSKGPYQNWDDFRAVISSVFTEDYWKRFTDNTSLREYNGQLCFLDTAMGVGYFYDKTSTDTFRLESKTDTEIHFTLIGHYAERWTQDEINTTGEELHYYTLEFPMLLILTENGWRFDEFHSALLEEQAEN